MNIRTNPNIDRIVDDAIAAADLSGPQTGTIRAPRVPRYDAPADQPPVEFDALEDDRTPVAHYAAVFDDATEAMRVPVPDKEMDRLVELQDLAFKAMMAAPSTTLADMAAKKARWWFHAETAGFEEEHISVIKAACEREAALWGANQ